MLPNLQIIMQASKIKPFEICHVQTQGKEPWLHICLVQLYSDGEIMLLNDAQLPIDFEGEIITLRPLVDSDTQTMGSYRLSKKQLYQY